MCGLGLSSRPSAHARPGVCTDRAHGVLLYRPRVRACVQQESREDRVIQREEQKQQQKINFALLTTVNQSSEVLAAISKRMLPAEPSDVEEPAAAASVEPRRSKRAR